MSRPIDVELLCARCGWRDGVDDCEDWDWWSCSRCHRFQMGGDRPGCPSCRIVMKPWDGRCPRCRAEVEERQTLGYPY